jgi:hypothetical protein
VAGGVLFDFGRDESGELAKAATQRGQIRPIICRTHGLPLVYRHDDTNPPGWGVMFCEQNFHAADEIDFGPDTTLNMDNINEKLARMNIAFLEENKDLDLKPTDRIELRQLLNH